MYLINKFCRSQVKLDLDDYCAIPTECTCVTIKFIRDKLGHISGTFQDYISFEGQQTNDLANDLTIPPSNLSLASRMN